MKKSTITKVAVFAFSLIFCLSALVSPTIAKVTLKIGSGPHPVQKQQIEWMEKWAAARPDVDVQIQILSYDIYFAKVSTAIQASKGEYDLVWHNDDWGAAWMNFMEYVDDVKDFEKIAPYLWNLCWKAPNGRSTAVPFVSTAAGMFYRKDLIADPPKTWKEVQEVGKKL